MSGSARVPLRIDRYTGALLGLAVGDAVGTTIEFKRPGSFAPMTDMIGGGPFGLAPGQWTDDTSMALCLAESLLECKGFDARDQMQRYVRWWREGHLSSTGRCFDIGNTVREALTAFEQTGNPGSGPTRESAAGNGSLMRLAPAALYFAWQEDVDAIAMCGESSVTTHGTRVAVDACRYFGGLLVGALSSVTKDELLSPRYALRPGYWDEKPLHPVIAEIADGSFKRKEPPAIRGSGYVAHTLEAALWAFRRSSNFRDGCLMAVNLGEDADTTGAVYGQLAGAFYGASGIPRQWVERLAEAELIWDFAVRLSSRAAGD
jgi:ADP-ribosyl-[dinitrogen reductase] hydrolase